MTDDLPPYVPDGIEMIARGAGAGLLYPTRALDAMLIPKENRLPTDGQALLKVDYPDLYKVLCGSEDRCPYGETAIEFNVPDLNGYVIADGQALPRPLYPGLYGALRANDERRRTYAEDVERYRQARAELGASFRRLIESCERAWRARWQ